MGNYQMITKIYDIYLFKTWNQIWQKHETEPEAKYHKENKIAPNMVGSFVANMYWIIFLAFPDLRPTVSYLDPYGAKLLHYGPS